MANAWNSVPTKGNADNLADICAFVKGERREHVVTKKVLTEIKDSLKCLYAVTLCLLVPLHLTYTDSGCE